MDEVAIQTKVQNYPKTVDKYLNNSDLESRKPREIITKIDEFKEIIYPLQSSTKFA